MATIAQYMRDLQQQYIRDGWIIEHGGKHLKMRLPGRKDFITLPTTPGDRRALLNIRALARRYQRRGPTTA